MEEWAPRMEVKLVKEEGRGELDRIRQHGTMRRHAQLQNSASNLDAPTAAKDAQNG
jgi:hypothetical protein